MKKSLPFIVGSLLLLGAFVMAENNYTGGNLSGTGNHTENQTGNTHTKQVKTSMTLTTGAIVCVQTALTKREAAIKAGMDTYGASWVSAFTARTAAFTDAFTLSTVKEIKKAIDAAWKVYNSAIKVASKVKKANVQTTWSAYRTDLKACNNSLGKQLMGERGTNDMNY